MRRPFDWVMGLVLAVFALGIALVPLERAWFTAALSKRFSLIAESGLGAERVAQTAEQVRAFVVEGTGTLPASVDGRSGFDAAAVSHLADVHDLLAAAALITFILGAVVLLWSASAVVRRRPADMAPALGIGAVLTVALPLVTGVFAVADFDTFFTAFHGLFFSAGTWTFPYDSLLIQLFPEPFWASAAAAWAGLVVGMAALYGVTSVFLARNQHAERA